MAEELEPWALAQKMARRAKEAGAWIDTIPTELKYGGELYSVLNCCSICPTDFQGLPGPGISTLTK